MESELNEINQLSVELTHLVGESDGQNVEQMEALTDFKQGDT